MIVQVFACYDTPPRDIGGAVQDGLHEEELLDVVPDLRGKIDHVVYWVQGVLIANLRKKFQFFYLSYHNSYNIPVDDDQVYLVFFSF